MSQYVSETLRQLVAERANFRCEYCLIPERNSFYTFQIDHIISLKHGGATDPDNLAFSCVICNRNKGSDLGTILDNPDSIIRFFNPRKDDWPEHFAVTKEGVINPQTPVAQATVKILGLNHPDSILERRILIAAGLYP